MLKEKVTQQNITETLEKNYMPYAVSVIVSRAIPEIDGFKPSHRKLLYTMYKKGLLNGARTKSANIVGETMKLNPHGDQAIYETMVRLAKGNEALLHPFVDSKGNFGKVYSRDMAYAASRYTEAKLDDICSEVFKDIDKDTVDFVDNYDSTMKEPTLLPVSFPNILVNPNQGIAVGMASNFCSFNLSEVCQTTIELISNADFDIHTTLLAPDFPTGGQIVYSKKAIDEIYNSGKGTFKIRSKYEYNKKENCIEITEIPYTTTIEAIIDKIAEVIKSGKIKEINDVRDETDFGGLKITIDLKRGTDPDKLMQKLFKLTALEDVFACNFNLLIGSTPKVLGVKDILLEWLAFRLECIKRKLYYDLKDKEKKLHLLLGLKKILLDIDKAVRIVRDTENDSEVVPNLMIGFGVDQVQAEFIAEIKLRNLNKQHVLNKIAEVEDLKAQIEKLNEILGSKRLQNKIIIEELNGIIKKFGKKRKTDIIFEDEIEEFVHEEHIEDYAVTLFLSKEGYFKKITPQSLRMSSEHKLKDTDSISQTVECTNKCELLFFTDKQQCYKSRVYDFEDTKASVLGDYVPSKLNFDNGENVTFMAVTNDYKGSLLFFFKNGKAARVALDIYETKTNRKKLVNAVSGKSELVRAAQITEPKEFVLNASNGKALIVSSAAITEKRTKDTQGISVMTLKGKNYLYKVDDYVSGLLENEHKYRTKTLPAVGSFITKGDKKEEQLGLFND